MKIAFWFEEMLSVVLQMTDCELRAEIALFFFSLYLKLKMEREKKKVEGGNFS